MLNLLKMKQFYSTVAREKMVKVLTWKSELLTLINSVLKKENSELGKCDGQILCLLRDEHLKVFRCSEKYDQWCHSLLEELWEISEHFILRLTSSFRSRNCTTQGFHDAVDGLEGLICLVISKVISERPCVVEEDERAEEKTWQHLLAAAQPDTAATEVSRFFFTKLGKRLLLQPSLSKVFQTKQQETSVLIKYLEKNDGGKGVGILCILRASLLMEEQVHQRQVLDKNQMEILSSCAVERCRLPQDLKITKSGTKIVALLKTSPSPKTLLYSGDVYLRRVHTYSSATEVSVDILMQQVLVWYEHKVLDSLSKWSIKQFVTLVMLDLVTVQEALGACSVSLQAYADRVQKLQDDYIQVFHRKLVLKTKLIFLETFPNQKVWKKLKKKRSKGDCTASPYIENLLEHIFLTLFDAIFILEEEMQALVLLWHISVVCVQYTMAVRAQGTYSEGAAQQLQHDFQQLKQWLTESCSSLSSIVTDKALNCTAIVYLEKTINSLVREKVKSNQVLPLGITSLASSTWSSSTAENRSTSSLSYSIRRLSEVDEKSLASSKM